MSEAAPAAAAPPKRRARVILLVVLFALVAVVGRLWWHGHNFEDTDNAYVEGHIAIVSPRISGVAMKVLVDDNQVVKAGDVLVELDPTDYSVRVDRIKAQLREVDAELAKIDAQVEEARADALSVSAGVTRAKAQAERARQEAGRQVALLGREAKAVSKTEVDAAVAARNSADADVVAQEARVKVAHSKITASKSARIASLARKDALSAELRDAELQRGYTSIKAPVAGRIGKKNVEIGSHVQAGQSLLAVVQDGVWVVANFKEVQLRDLHVGQKASIRIDAFPGDTLAGKIDSFSPASGAQFSLLPPDNASGNFTKIVQRVPVKITFEPGALGPLSGRIVPGMSALVEVDLRQGDPAAAR